MSKPQLLYVIGEPGSGKTTALRIALQDAQIEATFTKPFLHTTRTWVLGDIHDEQAEEWRLFELGGRRDGGFGGTDALPMNVQPKVVEWLHGTRPSRVIAEGDRLANARFFDTVRRFYDLSLVLIDTPSEQAAKRRRERARMLGTLEQNASWIQGRITKTRNLVAHYPDILTLVSGDQSAADVARDIRALPFFATVQQAHGVLP